MSRFVLEIRVKSNTGFFLFMKWIMDIDLGKFWSIASTGLEGSNCVVELALNHY